MQMWRVQRARVRATSDDVRSAKRSRQEVIAEVLLLFTD